MLNAVHRLGRSVLQRIPKETIAIVLTGPLRGAQWIVGAGDHSHWLGTYERGVQDLFCRLLRPGWVFYDVGAHAGYHALLASRLVGPSGRVIAFEPHPLNVARLRRHVALNRTSNLQVFAAAVAARSGSGRLMEGGNSYASRLDPDGPIPVPLTSLDEYAEQSGVVPDAVKIDVEGSESDVIEGAAGILRAEAAHCAALDP